MLQNRMYLPGMLAGCLIGQNNQAAFCNLFFLSLFHILTQFKFLFSN